jgi:adenosylcobinamide-phosphate synthase
VNPRSAGLVLGFAADRLLGDPRRYHPVAGFGQAAAALERRLYADRRGRGAAYWVLLVGAAAGTGFAAERIGRRRPVPRTLLTAVSTWVVLGGRSLDREAHAVEALLGEDLVAARQRLTHLVGRETVSLDEAGVVRAVVESVAENTSDAVVASLVWGGLIGIPGLLAHRAANTLDAMVGHRSTLYRRFGWASARADDLLNLPASRLTAVLVVLLGDDPGAAREVWRRDAAAHPSPNAGPVEAAFAGSLGISLGGRNRYAERVEDRVVLGDGRPAAARDIARAGRLAKRVDIGALLVVTGLVSASARAFGRGSAPRSRRRRCAG